MMDSDLSTFELALLRTERDIADADDEMARLEAEIVRMRSEIARISKRRAGFVDLSTVLKKRLGHDVPEDEGRGTKQDDDVSVSQVSRNAFKGMAPAQAARKYLLEIGLPLEFSFTPSEIRQFVTGEAHNRHKLDLARARLIYESLEKSKGEKI